MINNIINYLKGPRDEVVRVSTSITEPDVNSTTQIMLLLIILHDNITHWESEKEEREERESRKRERKRERDKPAKIEIFPPEQFNKP